MAAGGCDGFSAFLRHFSGSSSRSLVPACRDFRALGDGRRGQFVHRSCSGVALNITLLR